MYGPGNSAIVEGVRQFVRREIEPNVAKFEEQDTFPQHVLDSMAALGLFGMVVPEEFGGLDLSLWGIRFSGASHWMLPMTTRWQPRWPMLAIC